jgi:lipoate---protein ligase
VGAVFAPGFVNGRLTELYDYDELRNEAHATMFVLHPNRPTLVLGSTQPPDLLDLSHVGDVPVRRRRGGGGLVLLQPDDVWIDWWIPAADTRWRSDVHTSSRLVGQWWAEVLTSVVEGDVTVHDGPLDGDPAFRLVCFAGRGPGEVFVDGKKAVGLTQWRVREGIFVSTVMLVHASLDVARFLKEVPDGLHRALEHQVPSSLSDIDAAAVVEALGRTSGPWRERVIDLHL